MHKKISEINAYNNGLKSEIKAQGDSYAKTGSIL
jgi:hypothetical protein